MSDETNVEAPAPETPQAEAEGATTAQIVKEKAAAAAGTARTQVSENPQPMLIALGALLTLGVIYVLWRILGDD